MSFKEEFFADPRHKPKAFHVSHWGTDPYSQGAWSQLSVSGSPVDRIQLGSKISDRFILAGEAICAEMPAMVNGAAESGIYAASQMCDNDNLIIPDVPNTAAFDYHVVVIGAGAAGIFAARKAKELLSSQGHLEARVLVLEARDRIGGRVHTVNMSLPQDMNEQIYADLGATWLQQYPDNIIADIIKSENTGLQVIPTDFSSALCATNASGLDAFTSNDMSRICASAEHFVYKAMLKEEEEEEAREEGCDGDCGSVSDRPLAEVLLEYINTQPSEDNIEQSRCSHGKTNGLSGQSERFLAHMAIGGDIASDLGYDIFDTSARYGLTEPGVGCDDHYIRQGYGAVLKYLATGLDIRLQTPVASVNYACEHGVHLQLLSGEVITAAKCICTVPVAVIQNRTITFTPELPERHQRALSKIHQGQCEKVLLRFDTRWWPVNDDRCVGGSAASSSGSNGLLRWYDTSRYPDNLVSREQFPMLLDYVEWLDMTDGLGVPIVMGFCVGKLAVEQFHVGSDEEIATNAALAFEKWAWYMKQKQSMICRV